MIVKNQPRQHNHTGKYREKQHDHRSLFSCLSQFPHHRVRRARADAAEKAQQRRHKCQIGECRLYHEYTAEKRTEDQRKLNWHNFFL